MLDIVIEERDAAISQTMKVIRILPFRLRRMVGPFIFMDHAGPVTDVPPVPSSLDVLPHPHIGLSTVSYLFGGQVTHRDSLGVEQVIRPGEVNWMTAGRGIAHSERFEGMRERGGRMDGIQAWVALPLEHEETDPAFDHYEGDDLPAFKDRGVSLRLLAGEAYGHKSRVKSYSPVFYAHATLHDGGQVAAPSDYSERAVY